MPERRGPWLMWVALALIGLVIFTGVTGNNIIGNMAGITNTENGNLHMGLLPALVISVVIVVVGWQFTKSSEVAIKVIGWGMIAVVVMIACGHSPEEIGSAILQAGGK